MLDNFNENYITVSLPIFLTRIMLLTNWTTESAGARYMRNCISGRPTLYKNI